MSHITPEYIFAVQQERLVEAERYRLAAQLPRPPTARRRLHAALRRMLTGHRGPRWRPPVEVLEARVALRRTGDSPCTEGSNRRTVNESTPPTPRSNTTKEPMHQERRKLL
jgi:hypothetical protein